MSIAETLLPEYDHEMANTRRMLERTPEAAASWKPHEKSMSLGTLARHLADIPAWGSTLGMEVFDIAPLDGPPWVAPQFSSTAEALSAFDTSVAETRRIIAATTDAEFMKPWSFAMGGQVLFTTTRVGVVRTWIINHLIHHRGQFSVYLREQNVPVPGMYGPSADES
jgi:uncharacterized damage-inducible protein DinB